MSEAYRDENHVPTLLGVSSVDGITPVVLWADPTTHRLLTDAAAGMSNPMTTGGDIIYGGLAGVPTRLANGNAGEVLTSQGTTLAPIWTAAGAGDMVLASVQTNSGAKTFLNNTLLLRNPANTFSYTITPAAIAADRVLTLPLITATDTLATLGLAQTFTAVQTMSALNVIKVASNGLTVRNPGNTFDYTITGAAIAAARVLNLPLITGTDTLASLGLAQTFSATQTFGTLVATTVNGNTISTGTGTLTLGAGKTLTVNNSIGLTGTDGTTMTFPTTSKTVAANDGSNMTLASQAIGDIILAATATTLGRLADVAVGQVLVSGGIGTAPAYSATPLVTSIDIGNADTSITRVSPGIIAVEGATMARVSDIASKVAAFVYVIDGGGSAITTGSKGFLSIPAAYTITGWNLVADQSGSAVVDVKKSTYAGFPTTATIAGADKPTLSAVQKNQNLAVGVWTTAVAAGDILEFNVDSAATVTRLTLTIVATKT